MDLVVDHGISGRGVFAESAIRAGAFLIRFNGPLLTYEQTSPQTLALQIGPNLYLGGSGKMDDLVNHSCQPNAGLVIRGTDVTLIAIAEIAAGEEIFFDYSTTMDEDDFELQCQCGTPACRGMIRDFKHLPEALKRRYADLGIVPVYNLKYVNREAHEEKPRYELE